jgi:hypothetical protein
MEAPVRPDEKNQTKSNQIKPVGTKFQPLSIGFAFCSRDVVVARVQNALSPPHFRATCSTEPSVKKRTLATPLMGSIWKPLIP